ncbi:MAG TPA: universal stress protein [Pseudonocardia sp.]|nr:universal stress protein [Pseudonocardia sp.]
MGRTVVVGTDGGAESAPAVTFALAEAARRDATLLVVTAVEEPPYWAVAYGMPAPLVGGEQRRKIAAADADAQVGEIAEALGGRAADVPVEIHAVVGGPVGALVEAARDADLLVVGHGGGGAVANLLIGSVAIGALLHAPCPVAVVPEPGTAALAR